MFDLKHNDIILARNEDTRRIHDKSPTELRILQMQMQYEGCSWADIEND